LTGAALLPPDIAAQPAEFGPEFRAELERLMVWRRDVRRFRPDPVPAELLQAGLRAFALAPSVGLSEPWRLVRLDSSAARQAAQTNFETANTQALAGYDGDKAALYARLKLSGMREAPVQLAVFCDDATAKGGGLGAGTMPEMRAYSCVAAVTAFWLALRALGLGLGWVSILDPIRLAVDLAVPQDWKLVAYLCIGYPETRDDQPELARAHWETRAGLPAMELR
jgi:5,6-dimethylbenzimidazole synthase